MEIEVVEVKIIKKEEYISRLFELAKKSMYQLCQLF